MKTVKITTTHFHVPKMKQHLVISESPEERAAPESRRNARFCLSREMVKNGDAEMPVFHLRPGEMFRFHFHYFHFRGGIHFPFSFIYFHFLHFFRFHFHFHFPRTPPGAGPVPDKSN